MKNRSSREMIKVLNKDGWYLHRIVGSHHHFKHPTKKGTVTVPHSKNDLLIRTTNSILKQA